MRLRVDSMHLAAIGHLAGQPSFRELVQHGGLRLVDFQEHDPVMSKYLLCFPNPRHAVRPVSVPRPRPESIRISRTQIRARRGYCQGLKREFEPCDRVNV
jgi:hypothetical protein